MKIASDTIAPALSEQAETALKAQLQREADTDLLTHLVRGIFAYPFLIVALAVTTRFASEHPALFWTGTTALTIALAFRMVLAAFSRRVQSHSSWLFHWPLFVSVWICSAVCGLFYGSTIFFYGLASWPSTIAMLWMAGIAAGSTVSFTPSFRLLLVHIILMFAPSTIVALFLAGKQGNGIALGTVTFCAFLLMQGRNLHLVYWKWLRERALETARTRELEMAKLAAESANISKGLFLANMSHEIRTPMHGILGMANLAIESDSPDDAREHMKVLSRSAEGLLRVLNDILDFSKIEAGKMTLDTVPFSLRNVVAETRDVLMPQANAKNITLKCSVASGIRDQLLGDPARLRQVLINLVGNAVKFTAIGAVTLEITEQLQGTGAENIATENIGAENPGAAKHGEKAALFFRVTDTGIGISKEQQELIFVPFSQADTSVTRTFGGTGLGLSICSQLVELMGGRLALESTPHVGSTFYFTSTFAYAGEESAVARPAARAAEDVSHLRILVAEDNVINQKLATALLVRAGHQVRMAANGKEAVQAWEEEDFDLILMDIQMPEMDGIEAVRHIRLREASSGRKRTHIVACSASAMAGDRERFLAAGMDSYLGKPFRAEQLYEAIRDGICQPVG